MIKLEAEDARVEVDLESGGRLARLIVRGMDLLRARRSDPLLWGCYPMAPFAGRVRHGRFEFQGERHRLPLRLPPHAIHGTVFDCVWEDEGNGRASAALGVDWPFGGRVVQQFDLEAGRLRLRLEVHADAQPFPASIGWHPWFRRELERGRAVRFEFDAQAMLVRGRDGIPTGEIRRRSEGPYDDCFTQVAQPIRLVWDAALELELRSDASHWVVFDEPEDAICVEPQTGPPNALNADPRSVEPGVPLTAEFELRWLALAAD